MKTHICPTCGCSLVRLGISKDKASLYQYNNNDYYFCCQGCVDVFITDPQKYFQETNDLIVCPTCLAEKPLQHTVQFKFNENEISFCRCPHCIGLFKKNPEFYIDRLNGDIPNQGVFDHAGCCLS